MSLDDYYKPLIFRSDSTDELFERGLEGFMRVYPDALPPEATSEEDISRFKAHCDRMRKFEEKLINMGVKCTADVFRMPSQYQREPEPEVLSVDQVILEIEKEVSDLSSMLEAFEQKKKTLEKQLLRAMRTEKMDKMSAQKIIKKLNASIENKKKQIKALSLKPFESLPAKRRPLNVVNSNINLNQREGTNGTGIAQRSQPKVAPKLNPSLVNSTPQPASPLVGSYVILKKGK